MASGQNVLVALVTILCVWKQRLKKSPTSFLCHLSLYCGHPTHRNPHTERGVLLRLLADLVDTPAEAQLAALLVCSHLLLKFSDLQLKSVASRLLNVQLCLEMPDVSDQVRDGDESSLPAVKDRIRIVVHL
jgi:hypothetical protein